MENMFANTGIGKHIKTVLGKVIYYLYISHYFLPLS